MKKKKNMKQNESKAEREDSKKETECIRRLQKLKKKN